MKTAKHWQPAVAVWTKREFFLGGILHHKINECVFLSPRSAKALVKIEPLMYALFLFLCFRLNFLICL